MHKNIHKISKYCTPIIIIESINLYSAAEVRKKKELSLFDDKICLNNLYKDVNLENNTYMCIAPQQHNVVILVWNWEDLPKNNTGIKFKIHLF